MMKKLYKVQLTIEEIRCST